MGKKRTTARVEFRLSMPGRSSWNGRWSGEERNYTIVRTLDAETIMRLFSFKGGVSASKSWSYSFGDGWVACIDARIVATGTKPKKSDGFNGYDWMVDSIVRFGKILADHQRPEAV